MTESIADLMDQLRPDPWRETHPFTPDIAKLNEFLFDAATSRTTKAAHLAAWLRARNQPCLFAREAANKNLITFCILTENDIAKGDRHIRQTIQDARMFWKQEAFLGKSHAFMILILSRRIAYAEPGETLQAIALRLCQLYLSRTKANGILLDRVRLQIKTQDGFALRRKWKVGVNWFGTQADGRWWHDHRIPGGVGFSMNSVGHMARRWVEDAVAIHPELLAQVDTAGRDRLVKWALTTAMRTIHTASKGVLPGTRLAPRNDTPLPKGVTEEQRREIFGSPLAGFSEDYYYGWYHTDVTIPSEYFNPNPTRPNEQEQKLLFTYLHRDSDIDYVSMGLGTQVVRKLDLGNLGPIDDV